MTVSISETIIYRSVSTTHYLDFFDNDVDSESDAGVDFENDMLSISMSVSVTMSISTISRTMLFR